MKIAIIGNKTTPNGAPLADGGRIRTALYYEKLKEEGFDVGFVELQGWQRKIIRLIFEIKKAIKENDIVLLMAGPRSARFLVRLCVFFNKKKKTRIVFSMLGVGPIQQKIKRLEPTQVNDFMQNKATFGIKDKKMGKCLGKLDLILAQNEIILNWYKHFYKVANIAILENFRDVPFRKELEGKQHDYTNKERKIVFFSRLTYKKGILDLLNAVSSLNENSKDRKIHLDIWGEMQLTQDEEEAFKNMLSAHIVYKGVLENNKAIKTLSEYDFMVFPTKYHGEGTSGSIIESFLAGVPILSSSYSQSSLLIKEGVNGLIFKINDVESLIFNLTKIVDMAPDELKSFHENAYTAGNKYDYQEYRKKFVSLITGNDNK